MVKALRISKKKTKESKAAELPFSEGVDAEMKPLFMQEEDDDDGNDSDKELQIALREGLLKPGALNVVVEKKRPIINKAPEIRQKVELLAKKLPWIETLDVSTPSTLTDENIANDFEREVQFYKQAEKAVAIAVPRLLAMNVKVFRPKDYYAEMAKSDEHMQRVRKRLLDVQERKERQETVRRMREEKKYAGKVQKEVLENRQKEKKMFLDTVKKHRKGMRQQLDDMLNNAKRMQLDEEEDDRRVISRGGSSAEMKNVGRKMSRDSRNKKFGFGGQKKRMKHNDKRSFDDVFTTGRGAGKSKKGNAGRKGRLGAKRR